MKRQRPSFLKCLLSAVAFLVALPFLVVLLAVHTIIDWIMRRR